MLLKLADRVTAWLERWPWLVPVSSFLFGWASFALVQRGERLARLIAATVVLSWIWLLAEELLGRWLVRWTQGRASPALIHFVTQSLQLEMLFFSLPFLIAGTHLDAGQILFMLLACAATLICTLDRVYLQRISADGITHVIFHAFCSFLTGWVLLPIVFGLPLEAAMPLALTLTGVMVLACLPRVLSGVGGWRRAQRLTLIALGLVLLWLARAHIPAANLVVKQSLITQSVSEELVPGDERARMAVADLSQGVIAFVAIRAPLGLAQEVAFEWRLDGVLQDRIPATLRGGRELGYRLYSRKRNFPAQPRGHWTVQLRTPDGQLIGRMDFDVV